MKDTTSYNIYRQCGGEYVIVYKRGFYSQWKYYLKAGRAREFASYEEAEKWLAAKHSGGYIQLRLVK